MLWEKFYPLWMAHIGKIDREVLPVWNQFISTAEETLVTEAVYSLAESYNIAKERDNFTAMPNLWQLKKRYETLLARRQAQIFKSRKCSFCENSATVYVLDTGNYASPEFPVDPATYRGRRNLCVVPCPCCRKENYSGMEELRQRIWKFCRPVASRNELLHSPG